MKSWRWPIILLSILGALLLGFLLFRESAILTVHAPSEGTPMAGATTAVQAAAPTPIPNTPTAKPERFRGDQALKDAEYQLNLGPRTPGSEAHASVIDWIQEEAKAAGWQVELQKTERLGHPVTNVIAKRGSGKPWIILGAHFDSRMKADQDKDPQKRDQPVPSANDGAAVVAVLLELARTLPKDLQPTVWLAFFDAEDQGDLPGWDWILGSRALADSLTSKPDAVIIIDMIGDKDLNIYEERNSNIELTREIWQQAQKLGYGAQFIAQPKHSMEDDHTPFIEKGIPAVDMIDFDYPYWHTTGDTLDKISAESMEAVGETLRQWILSK